MKSLNIAVACVLLLLAVACCDCHTEKRANNNQYTGTVMQLKQADDGCVNMLFRKDDGYLTNFHVSHQSVVWEKMHAEIQLSDFPSCGYVIQTAREIK